MDLAISLLNVALFLAIAWRLEFHRLGLFTYGFFAVGTNLLPHYILMPLFEVITDDPLVSHPKFVDALILVTTILSGIFIGALWETKKVAPLFHRLPEVTLSTRTHAILMTVAIIQIVIVLSIFTGSFNPVDAITRSRSAEARMTFEQYELGYLIAFSVGAALFLHGWLLLKVCTSQTSVHKKLLLSIGATVVMVPCMASFGSRGLLFSPVINLLFVFNYKIKKIPISVVSLLFLLAVPVFVLIRIVAGGNSVADVLSFSGYYLQPEFIIKEFLARFEGFKDIVEFLDWVKNEPLQYGQTILQLLLRPIPRVLLADKPSSTDIFFSYAIYGRPYYGGGVHLYGGLGEMYYNFRSIGVFLWFIIVGRLIYRFHYGFMELMKAGRTTAITMMLTNYALMRGLGNLGINTAGTVQILMTILAQFTFLAIVLIPLWISKKGRALRAPATPHTSVPVS